MKCCKCDFHLTGSLSTPATLTGILSQNLGLCGALTIASPADEYKGEYDVTPLWVEQRLATEGKNMKHDVRVYEIPLFKTSNPAGGETVIIGG